MSDFPSVRGTVIDPPSIEVDPLECSSDRQRREIERTSFDAWKAAEGSLNCIKQAMAITDDLDNGRDTEKGWDDVAKLMSRASRLDGAATDYRARLSQLLSIAKHIPGRHVACGKVVILFPVGQQPALVIGRVVPIDGVSTWLEDEDDDVPVSREEERAEWASQYNAAVAAR